MLRQTDRYQAGPLMIPPSALHAPPLDPPAPEEGRDQGCPAVIREPMAS
jgi:hypothetical protein